MKSVTAIPTAFSSIDEKTKQTVQDAIYDSLLTEIAGGAEGLHEAQQKAVDLFYEILPLLPEDKKHLLFKFEEAEKKLSFLENEALVKYLINNGQELKNAIVNF